MFVHAGFRKDMIRFMKQRYSIEGTPQQLSSVINQAMRDVITSQVHAITVALPRGKGEEIFEAGPERGGRNIGGPFWTDFKVLQKEFSSSSSSSSSSSLPEEMMQVVGHTASVGSFRGTDDMSAICIDAAMYAGSTSTFLEIGYDKHFRLNRWKGSGVASDSVDVDGGGSWHESDVTSSKCSPSVAKDEL
jgi:hypothetical protein